MGAVYTATSDLRVLRDPDPAHRAQLLERYFHPYADALADLVDERLAAAGRALLLDVHSVSHAGAAVRAAHRARPPAGVHRHRPGPHAALAAGRRAGGVRVVGGRRRRAVPGHYVPQRHHRKDLRVASVMVEIRRDVYLEPGGGLVDGAFARLMAAVGRLAAATA